MIELANGNQKKVEELVKELEVVLKNQFSRDQRIKATGPRPLSQINKLIYELVKNNPKITEKQLLGKLAYALHIIITLEEIEFNDRDADICETVKLSAMRCRLSRMKKVVNKEISH